MKHIKITLSVLAFAIFAFNAQARDQIKIVGSSTVYPYATVVAETLVKLENLKHQLLKAQVLVAE